MVSKNYLVFDIGASSGRASVVKFYGKKFEIELIYRFETEPVYDLNTLSIDILAIYSNLKKSILYSINKYKNINSIGIDTWGSDFGFIDKNGNLISNPIHYRDKKRIEFSKKLYRVITKKEIFKLTGGNPVTLAFSIFNLYYLKETQAIELMYGYKYLMLPDILNYLFTGRIYNELTNMTTTFLYNQLDNKLEEKILERIGVSIDLFPKMIKPGTKIGEIKKNICKELDIKPIQIIAPATHDTASAVVSIPVLNNKTNWLFISMGTWCLLGAETENPIINDEVFKNGFLNGAGVEGLNMLYKVIGGPWIINQCKYQWSKEKNDEVSFEEIDRVTNLALPFKSFIDVDNEFFFKYNKNMPERIREYCNRRGQNVPNDIGSIARCVYESIAMKIKFNFILLTKILNKNIELIYLIGGGIKNKLLCQWIANSTGIPVFIGPAEATSIGNFLIQLKGSGEIKELLEARELSLNSMILDCYEPGDKNKWSEEYSNFLKMIF